MIDPHVHLRDWNQSYKETVKHGLEVAYRAGLDAVFEMPNTDPALTSTETIERRIDLADKAINNLRIPIFHGLYAGITNDPKQIEEVVKAKENFFPRVVGLKMFAGHSTGNMGIVKEEDQKLVYETLTKLGYSGVLAVHCEKESLLKPKLWNRSHSFTHTLARPLEAEVQSVKDQIRFAHAAEYKETLHICHISVPGSISVLVQQKDSDFKITCGVTPHHYVLYDDLMKNENGILLKMNPPLRKKSFRNFLDLEIRCGNVDWIETDHAPHTLKDKKENFSSGIPVLPYYPLLIRKLKERGLSDGLIDLITHNNIVRTFGFDVELIPNTRRAGTQTEKELASLAKEYEFDAFKEVKNV